MILMIPGISMLDLKLLRDVWRLKGQVLAISLVVSAGIAMFILALSALDSLNAAKNIYYDRYRVADIYAAAKRAPLVLTERLREIDGVATVYPRVRFGVTLDVAGMEEPATAVLLSVPDIGDIPLNALYLRRGRLLNPGETNTVLVAEAFALAHELEPGDSLRAVINGRLRTLNIAGIVLSPEYVYTIGPGNIMPDDKRYGVLWMNRRALEAAVDMDGAFNDLVISTLPGANPEIIEDEIDRLLAPYGGLDAYQKDIQISYWFVENELSQLRAMAMILPAVFLAVAAFLLNIVLTRQVATEREQIGILKAMGVDNRAIGLHYLKFAAVVVLVGTALGVALGAWFGVGMTNLYTQFFRFPVLAYVFNFDTVTMGIVISLLSAVVGTQNAIRSAVNLPPAEAMRPAPPTIYRKSIMEALHLEQLLSQPARMIVRQLERRPGRAMMSIAGLALSVAMLAGTMFPMGAIDHMIDLQYNVANREDVTLTFAQPKSARALDEVKNLPGVLNAEPVRDLPVRIRHGHRSHRTAISGITTDGTLRRLVDIDLKHVPLPDEGLMMSSKLAEILDVQTGGIVTLEVLEGRKPVLEARVAGIVESYFGTVAYMELGALNSLMNEPPSMSGAAVLAGPGANTELLRSIKDIPQIAGTLVKAAAIRAVYEIMAEFILEQTFINTLFAGLIAFGVVYNTARVSLNERARELASLMVLGFRRSEVAYVLLGELGVLLLAAIPLGMLLGYGLALLIGTSMDTEMFRLPVIMTNQTYAYAIATVLVASLISGLVVWRQIARLDIVEVLKTRE